MPKSIFHSNRRVFLKSSALLASTLAFPFVSKRSVLGANNRLNIAGVGVGGKGWVDINNCESENVVAVCDVDQNNLAKAAAKFPNAKTFRDYRRMFDEMSKSIDATTVSTPDHMHYLVSMRAIREGKHVYCQKPLTHTIAEARSLTLAARKAGIATQMGNQGISKPTLRRDAELVTAGVIGDIIEMHCWTDRPGAYWKQGLSMPTEFPPAPPTLDWDLWIGGAPFRPYHPAYSHFAWRGWWEFGTGAIGDMGCHLLNLAALCLDMSRPISVEPHGVGATDQSGPTASDIKWEFASAGKQRPFKFFWYDGGRKPSPSLFRGTDYPLNGVIMVGTKDTLYIPTYDGGGTFKSGATYNDFKGIRESLPKMENWEHSHYEEWFDACKGGAKTYSNFDTAGPVSEAVLLGQLALRVGQRLEWDAEKMRVTNHGPANDFVKTPYRQGWEI